MDKYGVHELEVHFELSESNKLAILRYLSRQQLLLTVQGEPTLDWQDEIDDFPIEVTVGGAALKFDIWEVRLDAHYGISSLVLKSNHAAIRLGLSAYTDVCWIVIAYDSQVSPLGTVIPQKVFITVDVDTVSEYDNRQLSSSEMADVVRRQLVV